MKLSTLLLASGAAASVIGRAPSKDDVAALLDAEVHDHDHAHAHAHVDGAPSARRVPTSAESAVLARRLLALTPYGTISTVYPDDKDKEGNALENRPTGLGGVPVGLPEYLADCEGDSGNPTLLALTIATTFRNAAAGSNISLSLQWDPPHEPAHRLSVLEKAQKMVGWHAQDDDDEARRLEEPRSARSVADLPRFSLLGYLEPITGQNAPTSPLALCFVKAHPDARWWLPGNMIHESYWTRLVVTQVYWIGGFGDRNYIGWIPIEEWQAVTREDWEKVRLPGERKGWNTEYDL